MAINTTLSNLYVERASSEHPLALWMLNEEVNYITQITDEQRNFYNSGNWDIANGTVIDASGIAGSPTTPILESSISKIAGTVPSTPLQDIVLTSEFSIPRANLVDDLSNINLGFYIYFETSLANSISFGYTYLDSLLNEQEEFYTVLVKDTDRLSWKFFSHTFTIPPTSATDIRLVIKINVNQSGGSEDYNFFASGLSLGQWSEDFNKVSYGVTPTNIPSNINLPSAANFKALPAFPYGTSGNSGYYLSRENVLFCKNFGVPLVYGSYNVTKLSPNVYNSVTYPSLILPGYGFLNERGRHNEYTIEIWMKANTSATSPRKIFGPIASTDGLYADHAHLSFKLGDQVGSHFVGEWFRPMMVHIRLLTNSLVVLLNGEEIITLSFNQNTILLPSEISDAKSQDWLGLYAYEDIDPVDIDTFAIYSYGMPTEVAKRHWVWGQAVTAPEQTNSSINAITVFNDYAFANYSANYNYPDFANWKQAFFSNVEAGSKVLSLPDYQLPEFSLGTNTLNDLYSDISEIEMSGITELGFSGNTYDNSPPGQTVTSIDAYKTPWDNSTLNLQIGDRVQFYADWETEFNNLIWEVYYIDTIGDLFSAKINKAFSLNSNETTNFTVKKLDNDDALGRKYLTLKPNEDWSSDSHFIYFDKLAILNDPVETIYGIFKTDGTETNAPLFKITNKFNNDYLMVSITGTTVTYSINLSGTNTTLATKTVETGKKFAAGINIEKLVSSQNVDIARFFTDKTTLDVFLAGDGSKKFSGRIYRFGFDGAYNNRKISSLYSQDGIMSTTNTDSNSLFSHMANYTLTTINEYDLLFPDIAVAGYWEDYMPLSYFSKAVLDYEGNENYELDSIQFNIDFPEPPTSQSNEITSTWEYEDLKDEYSEPALLTYEILDSSFYSGWENYEDMSNNTVTTKFYNTDEDIVRSYVSFQKITDGANKNLVEFDNYHRPLVSGILDPENINSLDWKNTAYEVTTGTIIYPPKQTYSGSPINFNNYAMVYHLEFVSKGIIHQPIRLRELQLASQVLERTEFTPVGSRFGVPAFYYSRSGLYFDLKGKNPITTYKKSTPHLYLNRQSGWAIKGEFSSTTDRGLSILVNQSRAERTQVGSVQMWIRFYQDIFPAGPIMVFSINHKNGIYDFFLEADSSQKRGFIFAVDRESSEILDTPNYYINGQPVNTPFLINEEWTVLSVEFPNLLNFDEVSGTINLNGPLMYNNISYTLATNIERTESLETRTWSSIEELGTWEYLRDEWKPTIATWQDVKVISQSQVYNINSKATYERYTGSNRIIVDDESAGLLISPEKFTAYKEVSWSNLVKVPA